MFSRVELRRWAIFISNAITMLRQDERIDKGMAVLAINNREHTKEKLNNILDSTNDNAFVIIPIGDAEKINVLLNVAREAMIAQELMYVGDATATAKAAEYDRLLPKLQGRLL